ncbi:MAG: formimidoylglutamase [Flavobacteriaceae bacterium]|nr:formimidoylglutamase [Flavobacteriaceae bacterium]
MDFDFLQPVSNNVLEELNSFNEKRFGTSIKIHSEDYFPEFDNVTIAIISVQEDRDSINNKGTGTNFSIIRKELYQLFIGNWNLKIIDLGTIPKGNTINDTHFAVKKITNYLIKKNIIPIVIGGSQSLTYPMYRAYDDLEQTVNLVSVDHKFDLENVANELCSRNYLSKIVMDEPNNLFNFSNIGYQTFYNSQNEIDLLEKLYFDSYRLGEINKDLTIAEPILRDADIVSIDLGSLKQSESPANNNTSPNGFYGEEMCAILRYAGLSDKISALGIFEYNPLYDTKNQTAKLIAQLIWYFIEGVNYRIKEYPFESKKKYTKYIVPIDNEIINFYKSNKSNRWWMEISNNKFKKETLIPCTYNDYLEANNQNLPKRWWKTLRKLT